MKLWLLAGLLSAAMIQCAAASPEVADCELDLRQPVREAMAASEARETPKATRITRETASNANSRAASQRRAVRNDTRRRNGNQRRIPDAMLIDRRGVI